MYIIAEAGCNHMGDKNIAHKMIDMAKRCGANAIKFQKRNVKELLTQAQYDKQHPVPRNSFGATYGEHREYLEFDIDTHYELRKHARLVDIDYGCSVWDKSSIDDLKDMEIDFIKFPSAWNTDKDAIIKAFCLYRQVHISTGMTMKDELNIIKDVLDVNGGKYNTVVYACTSGYPLDFEDIYLYQIENLMKLYPNASIGFSGHHLGIAVDIAAMILGATYIERHFTLNRTWKGTDHAASLEPDGLEKLVRDIANVKKALKYKTVMPKCEMEQRAKLKRL